MRKKDWLIRIVFDDGTVEETRVRFDEPLGRDRAREALLHSLNELSRGRVKEVEVVE